MNQDHDYITEEKKEELERELKELAGPKRKQILDALVQAKLLGDLSENAEYHQAREDQGHLEDRIKKIEYILKNSSVINKGTKNIVEIGSKIIVMKEGDEKEKTFTIVGPEESDTASGKISYKSPLGEAVLGKVAGDDVCFQTPSGCVNYKIISIE